jgi:hypothetical protein
VLDDELLTSRAATTASVVDVAQLEHVAQAPVFLVERARPP